MLNKSVIIITNQKEAESLLKSKDDYIIKLNFEYKKILNNFYAPDKFLFFVHNNDVLPLVIKNNIVSFYGGFHYNEYNYIPENKILINYAIYYLKNNNLNFRLLSITNDYFKILENDYFKYDVPYGANWEIKNLQNYSFTKILNDYNSKQRNNLIRCLKKSNNYLIKDINEHMIKLVLNKSKEYFKNRNITFGWEGKEELFFKLYKYFKNKFNIIFKGFYKDNILIGTYLLIYSSKEIIYFFGGPVINDNNISTIIYNSLILQSQKISKKLNINKLDAMRGSFGYKKKFGFVPNPLYALVRDDKWLKMIDNDFTLSEYNKLFNRNLKEKEIK